MADRVSVSFKLGGRLSAAVYADLAAVIVSEGLSVEWDGPDFETSHRTEGEPLELFANEVAWGRVEALESFCAEHGLPYHFWAGGFFAEWGPSGSSIGAKACPTPSSPTSPIAS